MSTGTTRSCRSAGEVDLLIVDDWAMAPTVDAEPRDFLDVVDA
jgi:hypothetical protein